MTIPTVSQKFTNDHFFGRAKHIVKHPEVRHGGIFRRIEKPSYLSSCFSQASSFIAHHPISCAIAAIGLIGLSFYLYNRFYHRKDGENPT